jgi:hypothetical protein
MYTLDLTAEHWQKARVVHDFFKQETTCLDAQGKLTLQPQYVVAIDDDPISAYYAAIIMKKTMLQFGKYPKLLCVGGKGMLSKYLNRLEDGTVLSEGQKLFMTTHQIHDFPAHVLDSGNNTGANLKEIIDYLAAKGNSDAPIVFCPTQRLSKRLERTVVFTPQQFPGTKPLNAYYYVHGETLEEVLQPYNGKGLAKGLLLLSELAAVYDRTGTEKYVGKYMAPYDEPIPDEVHAAGLYLMEHYPVRVSRIPLTAPLQFWKMYRAVVKNRSKVAYDLKQKIKQWQQTY